MVGGAEVAVRVVRIVEAGERSGPWGLGGLVSWCPSSRRLRVHVLMVDAGEVVGVLLAVQPAGSVAWVAGALVSVVSFGGAVIGAPAVVVEVPDVGGLLVGGGPRLKMFAHWECHSSSGPSVATIVSQHSLLYDTL